MEIQEIERGFYTHISEHTLIAQNRKGSSCILIIIQQRTIVFGLRRLGSVRTALRLAKKTQKKWKKENEKKNIPRHSKH
jgi:hypothetical protein